MHKQSKIETAIKRAIGVIIIIGTLSTVVSACSSAHAALKLESATSKAVFLNGSGSQISPIEATTLSIKGEKVLKCTEVEAVASDKGNISLKAKK